MAKAVGSIDRGDGNIIEPGTELDPNDFTDEEWAHFVEVGAIDDPDFVREPITNPVEADDAIEAGATEIQGRQGPVPPIADEALPAQVTSVEDADVIPAGSDAANSERTETGPAEGDIDADDTNPNV
jgi:hypothetical protein